MPSLTITTTTEDAARIAAAFGARLRPGGSPATAEEVRQQVVQFMRRVVQEYEQRLAAEQAIANVTIINPE